MNRKNVVVLHCDQLRYDSLGCNGNPYARTPNIDRLAAEGSVFTRHIAANPVCMPSRASLMTGLYPPGHNVWSNGVALNRAEYVQVDKTYSEYLPAPLVPEPPTLADMFAAAEYDTTAFGKLHLTPNIAPLSLGYQESAEVWRNGGLDHWHGPYYGFRHVEMTNSHGEGPCRLGHYANWLRKMAPEVHREVVQGRKEREKDAPVPQLDDLYPSALPLELHNSIWLANRFSEYLRNERPDDKPFFAFVGFPDPHHPFTPCHDVMKDFENIEVKLPSDPTGEGRQGAPVSGGTSIEDLDEEQKKTVLRYTYAMVYQIDVAVGRILGALENAGLREQTIVVFTSDHGDFLCDHGLLRKGEFASNALLHVPFVLSAPGTHLPPQVDTVMSNCDVMPTLAALAGVATPTWQHGQDICSAIRDGEERKAFAYCFKGVPERNNHTVYDSSHRFTYYPHSGYTELFDHGEDPGECRNVASDPSNRAMIDAMIQMLGQRTLEHSNPILGHVGVW